jgi:hypothetical protein
LFEKETANLTGLKLLALLATVRIEYDDFGRGKQGVDGADGSPCIHLHKKSVQAFKIGQGLACPMQGDSSSKCNTVFMIIAQMIALFQRECRAPRKTTPVLA